MKYKKSAARLFFLLLLCFFALFLYDTISYQTDGFQTCLSEDLYTVRARLQRGINSQEGPDSNDDKTLKTMLLNAHPGLCYSAGQEFQWRLKNLLLKDNRFDVAEESVIISCPGKAHGFIRKFSWAVVGKPGKIFRLVRLDRNGKAVQFLPGQE